MTIRIHCLRTLILSSAFALSYLLTGFLPKNGADVATVASASLVFLPHGIRVIAAWLYGWTSVIYLLPIQAYLHWHRIDLVGAEWNIILLPVFGVICVPLVFEIAARLGADIRLGAGYITNWKNVILVGCAASVINAVGVSVMAGNSIKIMLFYLFGDIMGMLVLFAAAMIFFRNLRKLGL